MADKEINLWLRVKDGVTSTIGNIKSSFSKNIDAMKQSALIFAGGFAGLVAGVWKAVEAFKTQERVTDQTNKVLASTAHAAGLTADEIAKMAREFQKTTGVSDEVTQSAQNILLTFTGIKKDIFPDVTKATLDMTAAMNHGVITQENLKQQAIQVGKALNDPIQGMSALRRVGVSFNEQQKEQIKTMQEAGNIAGAQKIMLAELKKEFGGSAENLNTLVGAQRAAQSAMGDMMEVIGAAFMPAFRAAAVLIKDVAEKMQEWLPRVKDLIVPVTVFAAALTGLMAVGAGIVTIGPMIAAAFAAITGPIGLAVIAVSAITSAFLYFKNSNSDLAVTVRSVWDTIGTTIKEYGSAVWETIKNLGNIFKDFGAMMMAVVKGDFKGASESFKEMGKSANNIGQEFVKASDVVAETFQKNVEAEKAAIAEGLAAKEEEKLARQELDVIDKEEKLIREQEFLESKAELEAIAEEARRDFEEQKKLYDQMSAQEKIQLLKDTVGKEAVLRAQHQAEELAAQGKFDEARKVQEDLYSKAFMQINSDKFKALEESQKKHWTTSLFGAKMNAEERENVDKALNDILLGSLKDLAKENIAAFRIMQGVAITETIMKTYEAAQAAFTSLAGIPFVGPALGGVAAGAAIAAGMYRVNKIREQKPPGAEMGGVVKRNSVIEVGEYGKQEAIVPLEGEGLAKLKRALGSEERVIVLQMDDEVMQRWIIKSEETKSKMQDLGVL